MAIFEDLRLRGQGLDLRGQGQGLQNVSLRTLPLLLEQLFFEISFFAIIVYFLRQRVFENYQSKYYF